MTDEKKGWSGRWQMIGIGLRRWWWMSFFFFYQYQNRRELIRGGDQIKREKDIYHHGLSWDQFLSFATFLTPLVVLLKWWCCKYKKIKKDRVRQTFSNTNTNRQVDDYSFGWSERKRKTELIQDGDQIKRQKDIYHHRAETNSNKLPLSRPPLFLIGHYL